MTVAVDPVTILALGLGLMTAMVFLLVAATVGNSSSRRFQRRFEQVASRKAGAVVAGAGPARSLNRRESRTPTMDRLVQGWVPKRENLVARLGRTGRQITIGQYGLTTLGLMVIGSLGVWFGARFGLMQSLMIGGAIGVIIPHYVIGRMGNRRVAAFINLFPDAIDLMVRALRSGLPISEAIINAGHELPDPVGAEFRTIEAGMRLGRDLENLLWDISKRIISPEFRFFIIALSVQRETGGNLAETLQNLSDLLRRRKATRAKARAMSSEARASMMILGSLPIIVTIVLLMTSPSYISLLFTDVRGLMLIGIGVLMLLTGMFVMTKMAKFDI